ncbi:MAG: 3-ketoacyl-ACP reductase [Candidatus Fimenecus sp.]
MKKTAIITGSGKGMGFETAKVLEKSEYNVVLCARHSNQAVADFVGLHPDTAVFVAADISVAADRDRIIAKAVEKFGGVNVLINNAGVAPRERKDMLCLTEADFDYVMDINLKGTYFMTQSVAKLMQKQGGGYIINTGSVSADTVSVNRAEYCISKAGIHMLTKAFAVRLAPENIKVFEIRPGIIDTDMIAAVRENYVALANDGQIPTGRIGTVTDYAKAVLALLTGNLDYATGTVIECGGGMHIKTL